MLSKKIATIFMIAIAVVAITVSISGCTGTDTMATPSPAATVTPAPQAQVLRLATTTSMQDTGLLDYILTDFENANNANVEYTAVGSGQAMALGKSGDVDILIVHSPKAEDDFMAAGYGWNRTQFAHNYFVIVGPANDPAGIKGLNASQGFARIALSNSTFVSRGDLSGTHMKELEIWNASGVVKPTNQTSWYKETGMGQADSLRMANEIQGYLLSDISSYMKNQGNLSLVVLVDNDPKLINKYDLIAINQTMYPHVNYPMAKKFIEYMTSQETQQKIADYGKGQYGKPLFTADLLNKTSQ